MRMRQLRQAVTVPQKMVAYEDNPKQNNPKTLERKEKCLQKLDTCKRSETEHHNDELLDNRLSN